MAYSSRDRASSEAVTQPQGVLNSGKGGMGLEVYSTGGNQQNYDYCLLKVVGSARGSGFRASVGPWVPGSALVGILGSGFRGVGPRNREPRQGTRFWDDGIRMWSVAHGSDVVLWLSCVWGVTQPSPVAFGGSKSL